ncbi:PH domain-containing protein [Nakamurella aerolata]|uniref:PH domain-containing protein n=1 Tax=Nakamurella aerolata TaxID=1656892 RepID=A0A849ABT6_9ACTN|nr:PH domain-containing protein [Nakamurella aerolata]NNG36598.1 PH domain-containing protein [Nakamurella aerolata]
MSSTVPAPSPGPSNSAGAGGHDLGGTDDDLESLSSGTVKRYRLPWVAILLPLALVLVAGPLASTGGLLTVLWLVPLLALVWLLVTRTVAAPTGLTVTGLRGRRRICWDGLRLLRDGQRWVVAIEPNDRRTRLPMVTAVDLPTLVGLSDERATVITGPLPTAKRKRR